MTQSFHKTVDIKAVDEENRTATGAVLVPNELDHQHDFLRPDAVRRFHSDDVETGVMHSAFPEDAAHLERSEVIDSAEEIGDETFPAGTWVATRKYEDDDLWQLVEDGVLQGFSIGGEIERATDHETLPDDVRVPSSVDHESGGTELFDGSVGEVSDVDIPAVPRATYKGDDLGKSILDDVDSQNEFVELMTEQRGHDADDARRLYQYLTSVRSKSVSRRDVLAALKSGDGKPGDTFEECVEIIMEERDVSEEDAREICGALEERNKVDVNGTEVDLTPPEPVVNAAQAALEAKRERFPDELGDCGSGVGEDRAERISNNNLRPEDFVGGENTAIPDYLDSHSEDVDGIDEPPTDWDEETWTDGCGPVQYALWGGTATGTGLEWANETEADIRDAMEQTNMTDELDDATKWRKFKSWLSGSDDDTESEAPGSEKATDGDDMDEDDEDDEMYDDKHASDGDNSDSDMSDKDTDKSDEAPEWAKSLIDTVEENSKQIDDLAASQKTKQIEVDGETVELSEKQVREAFGIGETEKALDDAPEWAKSVVDQVEENSEKIDQIATQSGHSQQLRGANKSAGSPEDEVEAFKSQLVGGRTGGDD